MFVLSIIVILISNTLMVQVAWLLWVAGTHALMAVVKEVWAGGGAQVQYAVSTRCQLELSVMMLCSHLQGRAFPAVAMHAVLASGRHHKSAGDH